MPARSPQRAGLIEWGWAGKALEGGESGDLHVVVSFAGGTLVALIDGLGHGADAAAAARAAVPVLESHAGESVLVLIQECHQALRKTRGAVMSLASFSDGDASLTWVGVGNVDGVLRRARRTSTRRDEGISVRGGVVGFQLPALRAPALPVEHGDVLLLATDGIRSGFAEGVTLGSDSPQEIAESILVQYAKGNDDAHVVVARFVGGRP